MRFLFHLTIFLIVLSAVFSPSAWAQQYPHVVESDPLSPQEQLKKFHLPPGFEIELVASEPKIAKPLNLTFDSRGRLLVTQTLEYPYPVKENEKGRDAVKVLSDRDGDGRYETVETLIDGLNIPFGLTQVKGATVVFSIPYIYRVENGAGKNNRRSKLLGPFGYDDTHGMNNGFTRWLDGWIYACHGFRNTSEIAGSDGNKVSMNSGNTYRFRADGTRVEHWTHGQVNPFGLCFDPLGNIYTADCHSKPMYQLLRGAYYPSFSKPHDGLGFGPTLIEHSHGSTGIGGIAFYAAAQFPPPYRDTIFVANPITHRINHDRLKQFGSTYRGIEQPDFLRCDDPWFRPVDLQVGPDGALYVADFYNRIIGHYEVPLDHPQRDRHRGRIWRIVYKPAKNAPATSRKIPDLTRESLPQLWQRLAEVNLTVRTLATHEIVDRFGQDARKSIRTWIGENATPTQRTHGMWVLERTGGVEARLLGRLATDKSRLVRVHAMKLLANRQKWDRDTAKLVFPALQDDDAFVRRAAADALARHPSPENVEPLLMLWSETPVQDTHLIHVARIALRDQLATEDGLSAARKQMDQTDAMRRLMDVCLGVRNAESAAFVLSGIRSGKVDPARRSEMLHHVVRYSAVEQLNPIIREIVAAEQKRPPEKIDTLLTLNRALQERGAKLPLFARTAAVALADGLCDSKRDEKVSRGVRLAGELKLTELYDQLQRIAVARTRGNGLRIAALDACMATRPQQTVAVLASMLSDSSESGAIHRKAVDTLAAVNNRQSRKLLADQFKTAPYRLAVEIAIRLARNAAGAETLLAAVGQGKASPQLLQERNVVQTFRSSKLPNWEKRLAKLTTGLPPADASVDRLIAQRRTSFLKARPDAKIGAVLFKKNCSACHRLGNEGTKVGPELDGIGNRGLDRLLEDVLDPSRNLDPAFRGSLLETVDGKVLSVLVTGQEGKVLTYVDRTGKQFRIPLADIAQRNFSPLSAMPNNVAQLLKEDEFYHLIAFLLQQRQIPESSKK